MALAHLPRLALVLQDRLHLFEKFRRDERFVFTLIHFAFPFHDADVDAICEKLPDSPL